MTRLPIASVMVFCLLGSVGCSNSNPAGYPDVGDVSGTVTLDGQPLADARVAFTPPIGGRTSTGRTDSAGKYTLTYAGSVKGAELGTNRVSITNSVPDPNFVPGKDPRIPPEEDKPSIVNTVPNRYSGAGSELSADVKGGSNTFDFALTSE